MFHTFIDESEIEEWFEEEKQKLNKTLYDASLNKKDVENAKAAYDEKFSKLLSRYNKEFEDLRARTERRQRFRKPFVAVKTWWDATVKKGKKEFSEKKESYEKKKFNKNYEKLMGR